MQIDWFPLWLSLRVAALATVISLAIGLWLAHVLARREFRGKGLLETAIELPLVLPPTVLGYYVLVLVGQEKLLGRAYASVFGAPLLFTWQAAVAAAVIYAAPFFIQSARRALEEAGAGYQKAARALGAGGWRVFWRVTLPLARGSILAAVLLTFARSMADFGITLMIAGNSPRRTQTLSVAVYDAVEKGNGAAARAMALVISALVLALLFLASRFKAKQAAG
jgi:molybdate transport system permease protein